MAACTNAVRLFPYTINHVGFEVYLLLIFLVLAVRSETDAGEDLSAHAVRVAKISMLSVWFYSGVQKVVHGYYTSGEIFFFHQIPRAGLTDDTVGMLQAALRPGIPRLHELFPVLTPFLREEFPVSQFMVGLLAIVGSAIVLAELTLPVLALRWRFAIGALVATQLLVAVATWEWDFAFLGLACLLLFYPGRARDGHLALLVLYLVFRAVYW